MKLRIRKGDIVKVIAGQHKGKSGAVVRTSLKDQKVFVDGIGVVKRKVKPSQLNPRGGSKEVHVGLAAGKVALVTDDKKVRIAKKTGKEA